MALQQDIEKIVASHYGHGSLLAAILCAASLIRRGETLNAGSPSHAAGREPTSDALAGFRLIVKSRYLQTLSLYMLLFTITSTFIYLEQANMISAKFKTDAERTQAFANLDLYTNLLTLATQCFEFVGVVVTIGFRSPQLRPEALDLRVGAALGRLTSKVRFGEEPGEVLDFGIRRCRGLSLESH